MRAKSIAKVVSIERGAPIKNGSRELTHITINLQVSTETVEVKGYEDKNLDTGKSTYTGGLNHSGLGTILDKLSVGKSFQVEVVNFEPMEVVFDGGLK